jgi:hypothetical protein
MPGLILIVHVLPSAEIAIAAAVAARRRRTVRGNPFAQAIDRSRLRSRSIPVLELLRIERVDVVGGDVHHLVGIGGLRGGSRRRALPPRRHAVSSFALDGLGRSQLIAGLASCSASWRCSRSRDGVTPRSASAPDRRHSGLVAFYHATDKLAISCDPRARHARAAVGICVLAVAFYYQSCWANCRARSVRCSGWGSS